MIESKNPHTSLDDPMEWKLGEIWTCGKGEICFSEERTPRLSYTKLRNSPRAPGEGGSFFGEKAERRGIIYRYGAGDFSVPAGQEGIVCQEIYAKNRTSSNASTWIPVINVPPCNTAQHREDLEM